MPFYGNDRKAIMKHILKGRFHFASRRWMYVSPDAKKFVKSLLQGIPEKRPSAEEAAQSSYLSREFDVYGNAAESDMMDRMHATIQAFSEYTRLKKLALLVIAYKSTCEEIGVLQDMFHKFDKLHVGEIDFNVFKETITEHYSYTDAEIEKMFRGMDFDGKGTVRYCEFLAATMEAHGTIDEERLADAFDRIDSDDTGYITAGDLKVFLGHDIADDYIDDIIDEADVHQDRRISYAEFLNLWNADGDANLRNAVVSVHSRRFTRHSSTGTISSLLSSLSGGAISDSSIVENRDTILTEAEQSNSFYNARKKLSERAIFF